MLAAFPHSCIVNSVQPEEIWLRTGRNYSYTPISLLENTGFTLQIVDHIFINLDCSEHTEYIFGLECRRKAANYDDICLIFTDLFIP